jgi:hypothetical protein
MARSGFAMARSGIATQGHGVDWHWQRFVQRRLSMATHLEATVRLREATAKLSSAMSGEGIPWLGVGIAM